MTYPIPTEQWESILGALALIVVLAFVLERALAQVFEWGGWEAFLKDRKLRAPIALAVSYVICVTCDFDILRVIFAKPTIDVTWLSLGALLTASVIAGGSKGAILLFQGVLGFSKKNIDAKLSAAPPAKNKDTA